MNSVLSRMRGLVMRYYLQRRDQHLKNERKKTAKRYMTSKLGHLQPLTAAQKEEIIRYWGQYVDVTNELSWFEFYNTFCGDKAQLKYYVPDSLMYGDIDVFYTDPRRSYELDDKNLYDLFFTGVKVPPTVVRKCNGVLFDKDYHLVTVEQALELCQRESAIIFKPSRNSQGGKGISFYDASSTADELKDMLGRRHDFLVQAVIRQHESLSQIHEKSINTIRIMTFLHDDTVHVLSSVLRMGRDGSKVDNASHGGIVCGIDDNGCLKEFAYDTKGNRWSQHPQGPVFKGVKIPGYDRCLELARDLSGRFCTTSKIISWDFAVGEDGEPILIEVNLTFGQVDFHQMCNGPIFGDLLDGVLSEVYGKK